VRNEIYTVNEPEELRPEKDFEFKQLEIESNMTILNYTV
jgi:hypothetical protein